MAKFVSPGVYLIEKDNSQYTPATGGTVVGVCGFANRGPVGTAKLITTQNDLVRIFGEPSESLPGQALEGSLEILETTDQLYFVRAAVDGAAADASSMTTIGACPSVYVSGVPVATNDAGTLKNSSFGIGRDIYLHVQVYDENGTAQYYEPKTFNIPSGTLTDSAGNNQAQALKAVIGGDLNGDEVSVQFDSNTSSIVAGFLVGKYAGSGAYMDVAAFSDAALTTGINVLQPVGNTGAYAGDSAEATTSGLYTSAIRAWGYQYPVASSDLSAPGYLVESLYAGSGYNQTTDAFGNITGNAIKITAEGGLDMLVAVNDGGVAVENFKTSLYNASTAATFIEDAINFDEGDNSTLTSDIIKGNIVSGNGVNLDVTAMLQPCATIQALGFDPAVIYTTASGTIVGKFDVPASSTSHGDAANNGLHYFSGTPTDATSLDPKYGMFNSTQKISTTYTVGSTSDPSATWQAVAVNGVAMSIFGFNSNSNQFTPPHLKFVQGTYLMAGGDSGIGTTEAERATAIIGKVDASSTKRTGIQAFADEGIGISIALVPGIQIQTVQNNLVTLAETSQSFMALLSCPEGIGGAQAAIQFVNGLGNGRTAPLNSSYAAVYFPHVKVFSTYDGKDKFYDPAIYAARQIAHNDRVGESWFAPAGLARGRLTKPTDVEVPLSQGDRDALYSGGNVINPIVKFPKDGIMIFGQRTTQRAATALDRINVRRLMIEIRKQLLEGGRPFVFEPNDEFTYASLQALLTASLDDIRRRRGIQEFKVICDETTNTAARVDRNELWCKVLVKPTKTAEIIVFEVNLTNQSAKIQN